MDFRKCLFICLCILKYVNSSLTSLILNKDANFLSGLIILHWWDLQLFSLIYWIIYFVTSVLAIFVSGGLCINSHNSLETSDGCAKPDGCLFPLFLDFLHSFLVP